jgi:hypothetical protein
MMPGGGTSILGNDLVSVKNRPLVTVTTFNHETIIMKVVRRFKEATFLGMDRYLAEIFGVDCVRIDLIRLDPMVETDPLTVS